MPLLLALFVDRTLSGMQTTCHYIHVSSLWRYNFQTVFITFQIVIYGTSSLTFLELIILKLDETAISDP